MPYHTHRNLLLIKHIPYVFTSWMRICIARFYYPRSWIVRWELGWLWFHTWCPARFRWDIIRCILQQKIKCNANEKCYFINRPQDRAGRRLNPSKHGYSYVWKKAILTKGAMNSEYLKFLFPYTMFFAPRVAPRQGARVPLPILSNLELISPTILLSM